jgi:hypothetical protein
VAGVGVLSRAGRPARTDCRFSCHAGDRISVGSRTPAAPTGPPEWILY